MSKRKSKILIRRAICLMLSAVVGFTALPLEMLAAPQSAGEQQEDVLSLENDFISVHMSGKTVDFTSPIWKVTRPSNPITTKTCYIITMNMTLPLLPFGLPEMARQKTIFLAAIIPLKGCSPAK